MMSRHPEETHSDSTEVSRQSPYKVLGVAVVVDQLGKGAKMIVRYPTSSQQTSVGLEQHNENLFSALPGRQIAKMFRPKRSLCGQPITLTVGGTVFCCRAVLMDENHWHDVKSDSSSVTAVSSPPASNGNTTQDSRADLVLFSVVVALAPRSFVSTIPLSGWLERNSTNLHESISRHSMMTSVILTDDGSAGGDMTWKSRASASFLSLRRVHVSLERLCRVLRREEIRCGYVSIQANRSRIQSGETSDGNGENKRSTVDNSPSMVHEKNQHSSDRGRHPSVSSAPQAHSCPESYNDQQQQGDSINGSSDRKKSQERIKKETLHSKVSSTDQGSSQDLHGNLAMEMMEVFHALCRHDSDAPPSHPLVSGRDGIVNVNRHIAVAIEPASLPNTLRVANLAGSPIVRPYNTLLFPRSTPSQVLDSLQSSGINAPLQQLLSMVRPSKPLTEIAVDSNLPLSIAMELAVYLVGHGAAVTTPVLTRSSRLAFQRIEKIEEVAVNFSEVFEEWSMNLYLVVSFLTHEGRTLGQSMDALAAGDDPAALAIRGIMQSSYFCDRLVMDTQEQVAPANEHKVGRRRVEELEKVLYSMALWLLSRQVLSHIQDYLVAIGTSSTAEATSLQESPLPTTPKTPSVKNIEGRAKDATDASMIDGSLFRELNESHCLNGNISVMALCWWLGLEEPKVLSWARKHNKVRVISRLPLPGDDWCAV